MKLLETPADAEAMRLQHGFKDDFNFLDVREQAGFLNCDIGSWHEADGTALADFGGDSTTPGYNAGDESFGIRWHNQGNPDPISYAVPVPPDLDASRDVVIHILAAKVGATGGDAVTWLIEAFFNVDGAAYDGDTDCGGTSSAMTGAATTKSCQEETLTIAAANVEASPATLTLTLQPTDGTLGTDDLILLGVWLEYTSTESANAAWALVADPGGSLTVSDGVAGIAALVTDGDDNDEAYLFSTTELFKVASGKPLVVEALLKFAQANTDDANVIFGLMDAVAADALVDNGAGPKSSYSGAVFFSVDGDTTWRVENSITTTQKTTELDADGSLDGVAKVSASSAYQTLRIEIYPISATLCDVLFLIDGVLVAKHKDQVWTNFTDAEVVFGVKAGGGNAETLYVDYVFAYQLR